MEEYSFIICLRISFLTLSRLCRVCRSKLCLSAGYMKDENCNIPVIPYGHSIKQKMSSPQKKKKQKQREKKKDDFPRAPIKRTTILIKKKNCIYLEAFRMSTKQLQLFLFLLFAITEWYSVNRTTIIFYDASETTEDEKGTTSPCRTNLCCAPTRTCFKIPMPIYNPHTVPGKVSGR